MTSTMFNARFSSISKEITDHPFCRKAGTLVTAQLRGAVGLEFLNYKGAIPEPARAKMESSAPREAMIVPTEKALADYEDSSSGAFINWLKDQLLGTEPTTPPVGH